MLVGPCEMAFFPVKFHVTFGARASVTKKTMMAAEFFELRGSRHFYPASNSDTLVETKDLLHHFNNVFISVFFCSAC